MDTILQKLYFYKNLYELDMILEKKRSLFSWIVFRGGGLERELEERASSIKGKINNANGELESLDNWQRPHFRNAKEFLGDIIGGMGEWILAPVFVGVLSTILTIVACFNGSWTTVLVGWVATISSFLIIFSIFAFSEIKDEIKIRSAAKKAEKKRPYKKAELRGEIARLTSELVAIENKLKHPSPELLQEKRHNGELLAAYSKMEKKQRLVERALADAKKNQTVIYPTYFNFICICQFIEYLESGRCSELGGASGCYNLYEMEKRLGLIIEDLNSINASLNDIKDSMHYVCKELATIEGQIDTFSNKLNELSNQEKITSDALLEINRDTSYIKACETFVISKDIPYVSREAVLMKALGDLKY